MKKFFLLLLVLFLAASPAFAGGIFGGGAGSSIGTASGTSLTLTGTAAGTLAVGTIATPATIFQVAETITTSPRGIMSSQHSTSTDGARVHLRKSRGTNASPTTIVTGDVIGKFVSSAYDSSSYLEMGEIAFESIGTVASTRIAEQLAISLGTDVAPSVLARALQMNTGTGGATKLSLYNLYTSASVFESVDFDWQLVANAFIMRTASTGGTARRFDWAYGGTTGTAIRVGVTSVGTSNVSGINLAPGASSGSASTTGKVMFANGVIDTATSGTDILVNVMGAFTPTANNTTTWIGQAITPTWSQSSNDSTGVFYGLNINPTINISTAGTKTSAWDALRIAVVETANPTGTKNLIHALAGASGTTEIWSVSSVGNEALAGTFTSSATGSLGWSIVAGGNTACNTTCTSACVMGINTAISDDIVNCTDATADRCLCAGAS